MEEQEKDPKILVELWKKYHATLKTEYRDELIVHYLHLVKFVVGRIGASYPSHIKLDDLYSSGVTGLIKAVEKFDPERLAKFESYAILLIKGAIIDELRELDWIPRSVHQKANSVSTAQSLLQQQLGRDPTDQELSTHLGLSEEEFKETLDRIRPAILVPLDGESSSDSEEEGLPIAERIADDRAQSSFDVASNNEFSSMMERVIEALPTQEKQVLMLYYYEDLMLKEIGKILGVSESRVSQIHTKALLKLRGHLQNKSDFTSKHPMRFRTSR